MSERTCMSQGCERQAASGRRTCYPCATAIRKGAQPRIPSPTADERFDSKVDRSDTTGCWNWTGSLSRLGYGFFWNGERNVPAHRWGYEREFGTVSSDLDIDHLCRNRACVRPDHLQAVSTYINVHRGLAPSIMTNHTNVCARGHDLLVVGRCTRTGGRVCRTCERASAVRKEERHKAANHAAGRFPNATSADVVREIRRRVAGGERQHEVCKAMGLSSATVSRIARGMTRGDVS